MKETTETTTKETPVEYISVLQVSDRLGVSTGTVYNWAKSGKLPCYRSRRRWLFKPEDVDKLERELTPVPFQPEEVTNGTNLVGVA